MRCDAMHGKRSGGGGWGRLPPTIWGTQELAMTIPNAGQPYPIGATVRDGGVNFCLFSRTAEGVELVLFDREDAPAPARSIRLDPAADRDYHYWHTFVPGVRPGQLYGYRVSGPNDPANGLRFDPSKVLIDPYGRGLVTPTGYSPEHAR